MCFFFTLLFKRKAWARFPILSIPQWAFFEEYDNILKPLITAFLSFPFFFVNLPFLAPWAGIGVFLYMTKLFAIKEIQLAWMYVWTGKETEESDELESIDVKALNESIYTEIIFETAPQVNYF